jgi:hypothetical protein
MNEPSPVALFRFSVLGAVLHRELARGELRAEIARLAERAYTIPGSQRTRIGPKTLEGWYSAQSKIMRSSSTRKCILSTDSMT